MFCYRSPLADDLAHIAAHMREEDRREVLASHGHSPMQAVTYSVTASDWSRAALWAGDPVALFGYAHHPEGGTSVWLLATATLTSPPCRRAFLRHARRYVDAWARDFGVLFNLVDSRAVTSRR